MKRFVIATASALILLAGSAAASVPNGPASRLARDNTFTYLANGGPGLGTVAPEGLPSLVPGLDPTMSRSCWAPSIRRSPTWWTRPPPR
jgi:hypothetical protein